METTENKVQEAQTQQETTKKEVIEAKGDNTITKNILELYTKHDKQIDNINKQLLEFYKNRNNTNTTQQTKEERLKI